MPTLDRYAVTCATLALHVRFGPDSAEPAIRRRSVFSSSTGSPLLHSNFRRRVWLPALAAVGLEGVHFHDLRHTGNQLTADAGANPKELMTGWGRTPSAPR